MPNSGASSPYAKKQCDMRPFNPNDYNRNDAAARAAYAKRLRLNQNMDQFPLAAHIVKQFLASVNLLDIKIAWPRDMGERIVNDVDWIVAVVTNMLYHGIVGYRVKYAPFYRAELVCSCHEFGGFTYADGVFSWRSTAPRMDSVLLPTYVAPGRRPFTYNTSDSSAGWLFNGIISHHDADFNTHNELIEDTLRASSRSSEGTFVRTVKFSPDLPLENVKRSIQQERLNPAYMLTESDDGYKEDAKALIAFTNAMVAGANDPPSAWRASSVPAGVEQQRVPPPRSFIGGMISVEEQILHRMSLLVFKAIPECERCIETVIQSVYDAFLKPEIFYGQYVLIYQDMLHQLRSALASTENRVPIEQAARSFVIYRSQIAHFAMHYEESTAAMVAFFSNLDVEPFVHLIRDVQERYAGQEMRNVTRHSAIRVLLHWLNYEVLYCGDRIRETQESRHPPADSTSSDEDDEDATIETAKPSEAPIVVPPATKRRKIDNDAPPPPPPSKAEKAAARKAREAAERKAEEEAIKAWEAAEFDRVTYSWKIAMPDIATQDYGQPSVDREKRDQ